MAVILANIEGLSLVSEWCSYDADQLGKRCHCPFSIRHREKIIPLSLFFRVGVIHRPGFSLAPGLIGSEQEAVVDNGSWR